MAIYPYLVVDVFTDTPLQGNPLAVFPEPQGLDAAAMQQIARELNLAETAFLFPPSRPQHAANVRIFTPAAEMRFAGHPTIGSAFVLQHLGRVPESATEFVLEELIGPVPVRAERENGAPMLWLTTPPIEFGPTLDRALCARALQLHEDDLLPAVQPQWLSAGNPNIYIPVRTPEAVDRAACETAGARLLSPAAPVCVFVFAPVTGGAYSRMFAPGLGVPEDPATGSATGPLAAYMLAHGLAPTHDRARFVSEQGVKMGRRSVLHVRLRGEGGSSGIEVGGSAVLVATASMHLP